MTAQLGEQDKLTLEGVAQAVQEVVAEIRGRMEALEAAQQQTVALFQNQPSGGAWDSEVGLAVSTLQGDMAALAQEIGEARLGAHEAEAHGRGRAEGAAAMAQELDAAAAWAGPTVQAALTQIFDAVQKYRQAGASQEIELVGA